MKASSGFILFALALVLSPAVAFADDFRDMVSRFGKPDFVDSTENDRPRPMIVIKWAKYNRADVKAVFVPEGPAGAAPPYSGWKLMGYVDMSSDTKLDASTAEGRLRNARKK